MKIEINGKEVELRFTFDAFSNLENVYPDPLGTNDTLEKTIVFMYYVILCSKKGWQTDLWLDFIEFKEWLNENPEKYSELSDWIGKNMDLNEKLIGSKKK